MLPLEFRANKKKQVRDNNYSRNNDIPRPQNNFPRPWTNFNNARAYAYCNKNDNEISVCFKRQNNQRNVNSNNFFNKRNNSGNGQRSNVVNGTRSIN